MVMKAAKAGVLSMLSKLSLVLTCGVLASSFSMSAQASPFLSVRPQPTAVIKLVRDGCGLGFHWAACGCIRNYTVCPVIVAPVRRYAGLFSPLGTWRRSGDLGGVFGLEPGLQRGR